MTNKIDLFSIFTIIFFIFLGVCIIFISILMITAIPKMIDGSIYETNCSVEIERKQ